MSDEEEEVSCLHSDLFYGLLSLLGYQLVGLLREAEVRQEKSMIDIVFLLSAWQLSGIGND